MSLQDILIADLAIVEGDLSLTFTWNGEDYPCIANSSANSLPLELGGFGTDSGLDIKVRKEVFTDGLLPQSTQKVIHKGVTYRILKVNSDPADAFLHLTCVSPIRGT